MTLTNSPTRWELMFDEPLRERVGPAPQELVNSVAHFYAATGSSGQPKAAELSTDMLVDLHAAIDELPTVVKNQLEARLLGIFFMSGLDSSAAADLVAYVNGEILGAVVIIDVDVFSNRHANDWATWRENTAFASTPDIRLDVLIARPEDDCRKAALQYILLHEFGHVMAAESDVMPNWWAGSISRNAYSFPSLSWEAAADGAFTPKADQDFPHRDSISLYTTPRLSGDQIPAIYEALNHTDFPTLYAASDVQEDFAESYATYVHSVLLGKPHEVRIYLGEELAAAYEAFWEKSTRAKFFEAYFQRPATTFPRREAHAATAERCKNIIARSDREFLGLAPFLRLSLETGDMCLVAQELLQKAFQDLDNAVLWMNLSTAFFSIYERTHGLATQEQALQACRQFHLPAVQQPARCRVLMLMAPGDLAENTPLDCLLELSAVDITLYYSTLEAPLPPELPSHDVLVVGLSETDSSRPILKALEALLIGWDRPIVNLPAFIPNVERGTASRLLQGVPGLLMPPTHPIRRECLGDLDSEFPIIIRPLGSHAGRGLAKIDNAQGLDSYLSEIQEDEFYISRFIDYSGEDGQFRKVRIALVAGQPFVAHMAVSSHWMIHYVNAGMYIDRAKCAEEAAFMESFPEFANRHRAALDAVYRRFGLDYICIDCAETRDGELLIFEVDHAMVVHSMDPEDLFPYKKAHMQKISQAYEDFLCSSMANQPLTV